MPRVLVLGASGYVGSDLIPRLVERRHEVRAVGRRPGDTVSQPGSRLPDMQNPIRNPA